MFCFRSPSRRARRRIRNRSPSARRPGASPTRGSSPSRSATTPGRCGSRAIRSARSRASTGTIQRCSSRCRRRSMRRGRIGLQSCSKASTGWPAGRPATSPPRSGTTKVRRARPFRRIPPSMSGPTTWWWRSMPPAAAGS